MSGPAIGADARDPLLRIPSWAEEATAALRAEGAAAENARVVKILTALRDEERHSSAQWIAYNFALTAVRSASVSAAVAPQGDQT